MENVQLKPIGIIHTPFKSPEEAPGSARGGKGISGTVELYPEYGEGLADLGGFSHVILIFLLHLSKGYSLKVVPRLDDRLRGLFATRAPRRPNPIGVSVVRLDRIEGTTLFVSDLDMVDGTPLLDIKPYVPESIELESVKIGWLSGKLKIR